MFYIFFLSVSRNVSQNLIFHCKNDIIRKGGAKFIFINVAEKNYETVRFLEAQLLSNWEVTHPLTHFLTENVMDSSFSHIYVVCGSIWTFFTVFHLEFDKEDIHKSEAMIV